MADEEGRLTTADIAKPDPSASTPATEMEAENQSSASAEDLDVPEATKAGSSNADDSSQVAADEGSQADRSAGAPSLFPADEADMFRNKWRDVQTEFVDQPREAVEQADRLVADLMQRLAAQFSETRAKLEQQWDGQEDVSTEDLRVAMTSYRSFFERLLSA